MSLVLLLSIGILLLAIAGSMLLLLRSGEARVGVLTGALGLLAVRQIFALWAKWGDPLRLDVSTAVELAALGANAACLYVLVALWRTVDERDQVEALHWDSMEAVRELSELATQTSLDLDQKHKRLLRIGLVHFGLDVGMVSRVRGDRFEVIAVSGSAGFPVARGSVFPLSETYCGNTLVSQRPLAIEQVADWNPSGHPARRAFRYESYVGVAIPGRDGAYGTLSFASLERRVSRFSATDKDLLSLMAQWLGGELERHERSRSLRDAAAAETSEAPAAVEAAAPAGAVARVLGPPPSGVDANAVLRRVERKLRRRAGKDVLLELSLAPDLARARAPRVPLESLVLSLVGHALDAMPGGGRLALRTANLEVDAGEPGVFPTVAPDRYVTLSVCDSRELDAGALSRLFAPEAGSAPEINGGLALSNVYRILQRCGGDLSVEVEPGQGTTFTVFLPRAGAPSAPERAADAIPAPPG